jgi:hypothetical protein
MMSVQRTGQRVCHASVMAIAKAAAGQLYEAVMQDNTKYATWRKMHPNYSSKQLEDKFIEQYWGSCLEFARTTLVEMLKRPDIDERMKEEIMDIVEKDYSVRNRRVIN